MRALPHLQLFINKEINFALTPLFVPGDSTPTRF